MLGLAFRTKLLSCFTLNSFRLFAFWNYKLRYSSTTKNRAAPAPRRCGNRPTGWRHVLHPHNKAGITACLRQNRSASEPNLRAQNAILSEFESPRHSRGVRHSVVCRGVAQPGRAPGSGPGGRRFKSSLPDHSFDCSSFIPSSTSAEASTRNTPWFKIGFDGARSVCEQSRDSNLQRYASVFWKTPTPTFPS